MSAAARLPDASQAAIDRFIDACGWKTAWRR
jgi:hypothetical protein